MGLSSAAPYLVEKISTVMSDNPYDSPAPPPPAVSAENPFAAPSTSAGFRSVAPRRSGALVALCILAILLGVLATISAVIKGGTAIAMPLLQQTIAAAPPPGAGPQQDMQRVVNEMQRRQFQVAAKYSLPNSVSAGVQLVEGVLLIVGGALTLRGSDRGRRLFLVACIVAILYELFSSGVMLVQQMEQRAILENFQQQFAESLADQMPSDPNAQRVAEMILRVQSVSIIAGFVWLGVWTLMKIGYFVWAFVYLRRWRSEKVFEAQAVAKAAPV